MQSLPPNRLDERPCVPLSSFEDGPPACTGVCSCGHWHTEHGTVGCKITDCLCEYFTYNHELTSRAEADPQFELPTVSPPIVDPHAALTVGQLIAELSVLDLGKRVHLAVGIFESIRVTGVLDREDEVVEMLTALAEDLHPATASLITQLDVEVGQRVTS